MEQDDRPAGRRPVRSWLLLAESWGRKSRESRAFYRGYGESLAIFLLLSPLWLSSLEDMALRWPTLEDLPQYLVCMFMGAIFLWLEWRPAARARAADKRTHAPRIEAADSGDETTYYPLCSCGWKGPASESLRRAERNAVKHVSRLN